MPIISQKVYTVEMPDGKKYHSVTSASRQAVALSLGVAPEKVSNGCDLLRTPCISEYRADCAEILEASEESVPCRVCQVAVAADGDLCGGCRTAEAVRRAKNESRVEEPTGKLLRKGG